MIVVLKHGVPEEKKIQLMNWLEGQGLRLHISNGEFQTVLGLIGMCPASISIWSAALISLIR